MQLGCNLNATWMRNEMDVFNWPVWACPLDRNGESGGGPMWDAPGCAQILPVPRFRSLPRPCWVRRTLRWWRTHPAEPSGSERRSCAASTTGNPANPSGCLPSACSPPAIRWWGRCFRRSSFLPLRRWATGRIQTRFVEPLIRFIRSIKKINTINQHQHVWFINPRCWWNASGESFTAVTTSAATSQREAKRFDFTVSSLMEICFFLPSAAAAAAAAAVAAMASQAHSNSLEFQRIKSWYQHWYHLYAALLPNDEDYYDCFMMRRVHSKGGRRKQCFFLDFFSWKGERGARDGAPGAYAGLTPSSQTDGETVGVGIIRHEVAFHSSRYSHCFKK